MTIKTFAQAENYLDAFIPRHKKELYAGGAGLKRAKYFLNLLGNPQNNIKTIHIAGTSGKGSTAYLASLALKSQGLKAGLFLSPHILSVTERIQINNKKIARLQFARWVNYFIPFIEIMKKTEYQAPSWFEIITAMAFCEFYIRKVDYAVIETGLGGLYDATNTIENPNKLVLLTRIGFDHMAILGNTLSKIAQQKAGIIHPGNTVISIYQKPTAVKVIQDTVKRQKAELVIIEKNEIKHPSIDNTKTLFEYAPHNLQPITYKLGLAGLYQAENASLAINAVKILSTRDGFALNVQKLRGTLASAHFIARFETKKINGKTIIIDGAHNPQKMKNFISSLKKIYRGKKFIFLIAFKKGKDYKDMLKEIIPIAQKIILTEFKSAQEFAPVSEKAETLAEILKRLGFKNFACIPNSQSALEMYKKSDDIVVLTGSLYFISYIYNEVKK